MQLVIRMTEEEKRELRIYAAENNMNMTDFIKKLIQIYGQNSQRPTTLPCVCRSTHTEESDDVTA